MKTFDFTTYPDIRRAMAQDPHRPVCHFLPPANWMNDPNGLIQWDGQYHLFYQHNPGGAVWGDMHWGHALSDDLVHWRDLPLALAPTAGTYDADGCWSGCAVNDADTPTLVYTGWRDEHEAVCLAHGGPDLIEWTKDPRNPVIPGPPPELDTLGFRDPFIWRDKDVWWMVLGTGIAGRGAGVLLYRSLDLVDWTYLGPPFMDGDSALDTVWECPNFFRLDDRWVLIVSVLGGTGVRYFIGDFDGRRFTPAQQGWVDHGEVFFAPQTFVDDAGRRLMFGWLEEARTVAAQRAAGWSGVMTLPRVLSLSPDGTLCTEPAPEIEALRGSALNVGAPLPLACELRATYQVAGQAVGFALRSPADGSKVARIGYDPQTRMLFFEGVGCAPTALMDGEVQQAPLALAPRERLDLRVFVDHSVVEIFANRRAVLSARMYPSVEHVTFEPAVGDVRSTQAWEMTAIW
jgi:beta-fructofuranosidase